MLTLPLPNTGEHDAEKRGGAMRRDRHLIRFSQHGDFLHLADSASMIEIINAVLPASMARRFL
jgi:hypothetical protein